MSQLPETAAVDLIDPSPAPPPEPPPPDTPAARSSQNSAIPTSASAPPAPSSLSTQPSALSTSALPPSASLSTQPSALSTSASAPPAPPSPSTQHSALSTTSFSDVPDCIPVRMLNEFTYCPRLGYLEWVDGEWSDNLETAQGTFGHRNVDEPGRRAIPLPESPADSQGSETDNDEPNGSPSNRSTLNPPPSTPELPQAQTACGGIHARSIMLSAPDEHLLAKLDLLELDGRTATPVDYKRGRVPDVPGGAYEPERVQLCAQGLILRENGFECSEGVLYFIASKRRVVVPFDDELVARTRQLVIEFRRTVARGTIPPPLVDSPKCPRCSLVGICLPDETNLLRTATAAAAGGTGLRQEDAIEGNDLPVSRDAERSTPAGDLEGRSVFDSPELDELFDFESREAADADHEPITDDDHSSCRRPKPPVAAAAAAVRKLLPMRSEALPMYVQEQGASIGKSGDRLTVKVQGSVVETRRLIDISQLSLFGNAQMSAQAMREVTLRGIPICHFTYGGWFHGITAGLVHKNVELRIQQFAKAADPAAALELARGFVVGKIRNARTLLRRHLATDEHNVIPRLAEYRRDAERTPSVESLLGIEGMAAKEYFRGYFSLLPGRPEFDVNGRNRRPPRDPVNAVLSFVYGLLVKELTVTLQAVGFDPMLGFYHRPRYGRPSLALDLAEEFRPLIGDSVTLMAFNNGEVSTGSFIERLGAITLTDGGRRSIMASFERRLATEVTHPIFGYRASYRRILEVQARLLARAVTGEIAAYPAFVTR